MTTMMTDRDLPDDERRAIKAARARRLTDPLGAKGHRRPAERLAREGAARRALLVGSIAGFLVIGGAIARAGVPPSPAATGPAGQVVVLRDDDGRLRVIQLDAEGRLVAGALPHVQTRST